MDEKWGHRRGEKWISFPHVENLSRPIPAAVQVAFISLIYLVEETGILILFHLFSFYDFLEALFFFHLYFDFS